MTSSHSFNLKAAAEASMQEHGFQPRLTQEAERELAAILSHGLALPQAGRGSTVADLRALLWSSIDNDTSRDLDQIEWAERLKDGRIRVRVAVADVDDTVHPNSALDVHAESQTTSVYTGVTVFPMFPVELSEGLTSLNENEDRAAVVTEFCVDSSGVVTDGTIYRAVVRNQAQLTYNAVGTWLAGTAEAPEKIRRDSALASQIKLQDEAARSMVGGRFQHGALDLETIETRPVMVHEDAVSLARQLKNRATSLIEEFMVAANSVMARTLDAARLASIRRVVRIPKRWDRIVQIAAEMGTTLPTTPDSKALNDFLCQRRKDDPLRFPDLSLTVIKLMGPGEYVMVRPGEDSPGHFGLAVQDYTHSTAPNRRFADVVTQRLLKAHLAGAAMPYSAERLGAIAARCTVMEDNERHVEREMAKRIAAVVLHKRIGQHFQAIVTGVSHAGTFVRALEPHVEGMLVHGAHGLDVGDKLEVRLVNTNPERGFIDFAAN